MSVPSRCSEVMTCRVMAIFALRFEGRTLNRDSRTDQGRGKRFAFPRRRFRERRQEDEAKPRKRRLAPRPREQGAMANRRLRTGAPALNLKFRKEKNRDRTGTCRVWTSLRHSSLTKRRIWYCFHSIFAINYLLRNGGWRPAFPNAKSGEVSMSLRLALGSPPTADLRERAAWFASRSRRALAAFALGAALSAGGLAALAANRAAAHGPFTAANPVSPFRAVSSPNQPTYCS